MYIKKNTVVKAKVLIQPLCSTKNKKVIKMFIAVNETTLVDYFANYIQYNDIIYIMKSKGVIELDLSDG